MTNEQHEAREASIAAIVTEFRRDSCHATRRAMAEAIHDNRHALRELQVALMARTDGAPR